VPEQALALQPPSAHVVIHTQRVELPRRDHTLLPLDQLGHLPIASGGISVDMTEIALLAAFAPLWDIPI
jgi:hypothetical protein